MDCFLTHRSNIHIHSTRVISPFTPVCSCGQVDYFITLPPFFNPSCSLASTSTFHCKCLQTAAAAPDASRVQCEVRSPSSRQTIMKLTASAALPYPSLNLLK